MLRQQDAPLIVREALRGRVSFPVTTELPSGWSPDDGPVVLILGGGTPEAAQPWARELIRVVAYAPDSPTARSVAGKVDAYLLQPGRVPGLRITPGPGLSVVRDDDTGGWIGTVGAYAASVRTRD